MLGSDLEDLDLLDYHCHWLGADPADLDPGRALWNSERDQPGSSP